MRSFSVLMAAAALAQGSMAHYCFNKLYANGSYTGEYEYVRKNNNSNSPVTNVNSTDLRCNAGALDTGNVTSTFTLAAGSEVGFGLDTAIGHPGPLQVYMSKASGLASEYDGSGEWFKVYEMGVAEITSDGLQWASNEILNFTFTLPEETPAGQYFLRVEHIALHGAETYGGAQFYISCAQIEVTSSSTATPSPDVEIPGVYTGYEPGILIDIYYPVPTNYTMPGPDEWPSNSTTSSGTTTAVSSAASSAVATSSAVVAISAVTSSSAVAATTVAVSSSAVSSVTSSSAVSVTTSSAATVEVTSAVSTNIAVASTPTAVVTSSGFVTVSSSAFPASSSTPAGSSTGLNADGTVKKYFQCGGTNYSGATTCESGSTCHSYSDFYSQCT